MLDSGVRAATLDGIVAASGAPKGSIYHRFATLDDLLAAMWIRAAQRARAPASGVLSDLEDPVEAAVASGLALHDFAVAHPGDARLLVAFRREDLVGAVRDPQLRSTLETLNEPLEAALTRLARRLYGRATRKTVEQTTLAVVDLPLGAIRRHLVSGAPLPRSLRPQLEAAVRAALSVDPGPR